MAYDFNGSTDKIAFTKSYSSITTFSLAVWLYYDVAPSVDYEGILSSTDAGIQGVIAGGGPGRPAVICWEGGSDEYNRGAVGGISNLVSGEWYLIGGTANVSTGDLISYVFKVSTDTLISDTYNKALSAKSPSTWTIGTYAPLNRGTNGKIAEAVMQNAVWPAAAFQQLGRRYAASLVVKGGDFYAPLVRSAIDVRGGVAMTVTGTTIAPHPPIIMPRRGNRGYGAAATSPPPPATYVQRRTSGGLGTRTGSRQVA